MNEVAAGLIERLTRWASGRSDVVGVLLVGSYARGSAGRDSDVDLVLLTTDAADDADDRWAAALGLGEATRVRSWGAVTEHRFLAPSGLEVEINIASPDWARADLVDPGTRRVVTDGARVLYDPRGVFAALLEACRP